MTSNMLKTLVRIRWAVRATLTFGVAASVAANILHAQHNPISQAIAAWPPLALLLTVELVSRIPLHKWYLAVVRILATVAIAGIAAWVSYWHMVGVASRYGETDASPYLLPVSVDGLIVVASISLVELAGRIRNAETTTLTASTPIVSTQDGPGPVPAGVAVGVGVGELVGDEGLVLDDALIARAFEVADTHRGQTGRDITRDQLRAVLRVSNTTASALLRLVRDDTPTAAVIPTTRVGVYANGSGPVMAGEVTR